MDNSDRLNAVDAIDLTMIKDKLVRAGHPVDQVDEMSEQYRNFLKLNVLYPDEGLVPTAEMDCIWHAHILDTRQYAQDCQAVFGAYLHHNPYFGSGSTQEAADLEDGSKRIRELYKTNFHRSLPETGSHTGSAEGGGLASQSPTSCMSSVSCMSGRAAVSPASCMSGRAA